MRAVSALVWHIGIDGGVRVQRAHGHNAGHSGKIFTLIIKVKNA